MYVKKINFIIYLALALVVGFGVSFLSSNHNVQSDMLSGDISKVNLYSSQQEDPEVTVIEEKLRNDKEFLESTQAAMALIQERVNILHSLTEKTVETCSEVAELAPVMGSITSLRAKAFNTNQALEAAAMGLKKIVDGKNAPEYEQASTNSYIGFQKIENQLTVGKTFVELASAFLDSKNSDEYKDLAELVAEWTLYCSQDAVLNNSSENLAYWKKEAEELSTSNVLAQVPGFDNFVKATEGLKTVAQNDKFQILAQSDKFQQSLFNNAPLSKLCAEATFNSVKATGMENRGAERITSSGLQSVALAMSPAMERAANPSDGIMSSNPLQLGNTEVYKK